MSFPTLVGLIEILEEFSRHSEISLSIKKERTEKTQRRHLLLVVREIFPSDIDGEAVRQIFIVGYRIAQARAVGRLLDALPFDRFVTESVRMRQFLGMRAHKNLKQMNITFIPVESLRLAAPASYERISMQYGNVEKLEKKKERKEMDETTSDIK